MKFLFPTKSKVFVGNKLCIKLINFCSCFTYRKSCTCIKKGLRNVFTLTANSCSSTSSLFDFGLFTIYRLPSNFKFNITFQFGIGLIAQPFRSVFFSLCVCISVCLIYKLQQIFFNIFQCAYFKWEFKTVFCH